MDIPGAKPAAVAAANAAGTFLRTTLAEVQLEATRWHVLNFLRRWLDRAQRVRVRAVLQSEACREGVAEKSEQITLELGDATVSLLVPLGGMNGKEFVAAMLEDRRERFAAQLVSGPAVRN